MPAAEVMIPGNVVVSENILNNNSALGSGDNGNEGGPQTMLRLRRPPQGHLPPLYEGGVRASNAPTSNASPSTSGCFVEGNSGSWNPELMSGSLTLVGPVNKHSQSVQVKVYRTSLEHFAVIYPQKKVCRPLGVLNLRNAHVERLLGSDSDCGAESKKGSTGRMGFVVRQRGFDSPFCLTFLLEGPLQKRDQARDLEQWMAAFRCCPGGPPPMSPPAAFPSPPPSPVPIHGDADALAGPPRGPRKATPRHVHHPPCLAIVEEEEV